MTSTSSTPPQVQLPEQLQEILNRLQNAMQPLEARRAIEPDQSTRTMDLDDIKTIMPLVVRMLQESSVEIVRLKQATENQTSTLQSAQQAFHAHTQLQQGDMNSMVAIFM